MRKEVFDELVESLAEMKEIAAGRRRPARTTSMRDLLSADIDVGSLRANFKLSQSRFAALLGISVDTLQNWEQGRRTPDGPAKVLLRVAATHPQVLLDVARPPKRRSRRSAA